MDAREHKQISITMAANTSKQEELYLKERSHTSSVSNKLFTIFTSFHAGYFRISLSLCSQALLWKTLSDPSTDAALLRHILKILPAAALLLLWSLAILSLVILCILYALRCIFKFPHVEVEFYHHVGMNYLFAPLISWLLLLQSTPFLQPNCTVYFVLWIVFTIPIFILDVKFYGQWFTGGNKFLSLVANPTSLITVIGNLICAQSASSMGRKEMATCMFSLGMSHYLVLFVTLYQRFIGSSSLPATLRPVLSLFIAAPSMASLAWSSISGSFDVASKMLFFISLFLFASLVSRPTLFQRSMRCFNIAWWAYPFPITLLALAATKYAQQVKSDVSNALMMLFSMLSVLLTLILMLFSTFKVNNLLPVDDPFIPVTTN